MNPKPAIDTLHSSKPDFRPEFVAYVYKREKMIRGYLERMEAAKRERDEFAKTRKTRADASPRGRPAAKLLHAQLKAGQEALSGLLQVHSLTDHFSFQTENESFFKK